MKPIWLVIGIIAIVLGLAGAFALGAYAFPQRPFTPVAGAFGPGGMMGQGYGMMGQGYGMMGRGGMMQRSGMMGQAWGTNGIGGLPNFGAQQNSLHEIAANNLNLTVNDLFTELQKGRSIADLAKEKGVSTDKIVEEYVSARTTALKSAVDAKQLTQAQADAIIALTKANAAQALTRTNISAPVVGGFGPGMMGGRGGMMGRGWR